MSVRLLLVAAAALAAPLAAPASRADVIAPPGPGPAQISHQLQREVARRLGPAAVGRMNRASSAIVVSGAYGEFPRDVPFNLLLREREGWTSWLTGRPRALAADIGAELDRLLADAAFWREDSFIYGQPCTGGARVMLVLHRGHNKTTRQPCGPAGLTGRLAEIAASHRVPPVMVPPPPTADPRRNRPPADGHAVPDPAVSRAIFDLSERAALAWNRGEIETFLAPYAEDVTMVWPAGMEYHKQALRRRALSAQSWRGPPERQMRVNSSVVRQIGPDSAIQTSQVYYSGGGRPDTQLWVTSIWQNRRGRWEITHEQIGAEIPGHGR